MERFVAKLKEIGYSGPLVIEREGTDPERWKSDMLTAIPMIRNLAHA
jgi:sugar phosphate isomerase/epimerase